MILHILWEVPGTPFGKKKVVFFALVFCKDARTKDKNVPCFWGGRRQGRGLPESSDSAKSAQRFHHAQLPLGGGAANLKASPLPPAPLDAGRLLDC